MAAVEELNVARPASRCEGWASTERSLVLTLYNDGLNELKVFGVELKFGVNLASICNGRG